MTKTAWIIFGVLCAGLLGGLIYMSREGKLDVSSVNTAVIQQPSAQSGNIGDHVYGNTSSKVILVEYGDYQCAGCSSSYQMVKQLTEKYKDKLGFVFRNYPLYTSHPNAFAASAAAEAAGLQGKYWEMHDKLYSEQSSWSQLTGEDRTNYFVSAAKSLGVDSDKLRSTLDSADIKRKIDFDEALGKKDQLSGTPSFYINGKSVGDKDVKDGKLIAQDNDSSTPPVWSSLDNFETLVIIPALKEAGIEI